MRCNSVGLAGMACAGVLTIGFSTSTFAHDADPCRDLVRWPLYVAGLPAEPFALFLRENPGLARAFVQNAPDERFVVPAGALSGDERPLQQAIDRQQEALGTQSSQLPSRDLAIGGLGMDLDLDELAKILTQLDGEGYVAAEAVPEQLHGIAGLTTMLFLMKVFPLEAEPVADKIFMGKIRDYTFLQSPTDPAKGNGHLSVDVCTDINGFVPLGQDRREFFHWDLEVPDDSGFVVNKRAAPGSVANASTYGEPFPGMTDVLPEMSWNPAYPTSVWRRGLDHKLHSSGQRIKVRNVYRRRLAEPDLVRLPESDWRYRVTSASCIDLFTQGPPPATFGELSANDYCLGRCAHPPIVNSGD